MPLLSPAVEINASLDGIQWQITVQWRFHATGWRFWQRRWTGTLLELIPAAPHTYYDSRFFRLAPWAPLLVPIRLGRWRKCLFLLKLGTGDAALTARVLGLVWIVSGAVIARASRPGFNPQLRITPVFHQHHLEARLHCIVSAGIRDIIAVLLWTTSASLARFVIDIFRKGAARWTAIRLRA